MSTRAFTLVELAAVVTVGAGAAGLGAAALHGPRDTAKQIKDATQLRNSLQAFVIFAQGNKDVYPLPSLLDANNATVKDKGRAKDTTANIFSIVIFNSMLTPELMVSPVETNSKITVHKTYQDSTPKSAVRPNDALWDPAFSADFTSDKGGNFSYAHLQPSGSKSGNAGQTGRLKRWSNTFNAEEAVLCNRGPEIASVEYAKKEREAGKMYDDDLATPKFANEKSNTFSFFKGTQKKEGTWWSGNVAWNDCHVDFIQHHMSPGQPVRTGARYADAKGMQMPDMAFFDEQDDPEGDNNFFGVFIKAGNKPADFKPIWD